MKVFELSKELNVTNKELITFLKNHGFSVSSHMQSISDKMIELARSELKSTKNEKKVEEKISHTNKEESTPSERSTKVFKADDEII